MIRLIYVAIRDPAWHSIPASPLSMRLDTGPTRFTAHVHARTTSTCLDLDWHLDVTGFPDGNLHVDFQGKALQDCEFARIGLCLHFDAALFSGAFWEADGDTGTHTGRFSAQIHPQYLVDGIHLPCIPAFSGMRITLDSDTGLDFQLEGDLFEIEDQRNWTDATFKAYTTPLSLGELHHLAAGDTIRQRLRVAVRAPVQTPAARQAVIQATALDPLPQKLPALGAALLLTDDAPLPSPAIQFAHWRLDLRSAADIDPLASRIKNIHDGKGIELVLHHDALAAQPPDKLLATICNLHKPLPLAQLILLGAPESLASPAQVLAAKAMTAGVLDGLPIGAGGAEAYADLARDPNDFSGVDFVAFPVSPQNHVFDTPAIFETLPVQEQVVREARQRTSSGRVAISVLTFGTRAFESRADDALPHRDERLGQVGAAWLGASLGRLALGGATSITLAPDLWTADGFAPALSTLLQIFTGLNPKARLVPFDIDDPRRVFLFGATHDGETTVFLINLCEQRQMIHLGGLGQGRITELQARNLQSAHGPSQDTPLSLASLIQLDPYQVRILRHRRA